MTAEAPRRRHRTLLLVVLAVALIVAVAGVSVAATLYVVGRNEGPTVAAGEPTATSGPTEPVPARSSNRTDGAEATASDAPARAAAAPGRVFRVTPTGAGSGDGSSWDTAGTIDDVGGFIELAGPGDEVWILGDQGPYDATDTIEITAGGDAGAPITIRGVAADGSGSATPRLVGDRSDPYRADGESGSELFKLLGGADHLHFTNLAFANQGNGVFRVGADISDLHISDMRADNVRRFIEDYPSGDADSDSATISGLLVEDVEVRGFSKGAIRLCSDTHDVVIRDVVGDSERQDEDGDDFAMGIQLSDTVHDVVVERVIMRNSFDSGPDDDYWNGDGFAAERDTYDLVFRDTAATGNTDAGYDLKSTETTLIRALAAGNKRNFRLWGEAEATDCVARDPVKRGGSGGRANVWVADDATVRLSGCELGGGSGDDLMTVEGDAEVTVVDGS